MPTTCSSWPTAARPPTPRRRRRVGRTSWGPRSRATPASGRAPEGPDWDCLDDVVALAVVPVLAEGRIHSPAHAARAIRHGAWAVVVGTAITHPTTLTRWFADAVAAP
ncbi:hypothetical protein [Propioniciclava sp.]|uniref:hypothetical protein n=1 Tax=Propioniciclava sp. TaxID=2038686 RepID=UPI002620113F|nr:hypothetical protein [Propioniciclava sp.]